jgi:hypothetical protein
VPFPLKLHDILADIEGKGLGHIVGWMPNKRCFRIHKPEAFRTIIMPTYLPSQHKVKSFQRQLRLYGFARVRMGPNKGAYAHHHFAKDERRESLKIKRQKRASTAAASGGKKTKTPPTQRSATKKKPPVDCRSSQATRRSTAEIFPASNGQFHEQSAGNLYFPTLAGSMGRARTRDDIGSSSELPVELFSIFEDLFPADCQQQLFQSVVDVSVPSSSSDAEDQCDEDGTFLFMGRKFCATDFEPNPIT